MNDVFDGRFAPITGTIGFLKCDIIRAAQEFADWQGSIQSRRGVTLVQKRLRGDLEFLIEQLLPLTSVERRRFLFIPTRNSWTAFLDNGHQGTDVFSPLSYLAATLSCEAVRATCIPEGWAKKYPSVVLEMYGAKRTDFLNYVRSISVGYDGKSWKFNASGAVQPFENVKRYTNTSVKERFTPEMIKNYLQAIGIDAFDQDFYDSDNNDAILVEKFGTIAASAREYKLADMQTG